MKKIKKCEFLPITKGSGSKPGTYPKAGTTVPALGHLLLYPFSKSSTLTDLLFSLYGRGRLRPDTQGPIDTFTEPDREWQNERVGTAREAEYNISGGLTRSGFCGKI